jgi:hypothetical protein
LQPEIEISVGMMLKCVRIQKCVAVEWNVKVVKSDWGTHFYISYNGHVAQIEE